MQNRKSVEVVNIEGIFPIYKDGVEALSIELVNFSYLNGDECGFDIIVKKGLFSKGDKGVYIQPDFCLPDDVPLFSTFVEPNGDRKKSKLGKKNRIRAIKFNFSKSPDSPPPVYSQGIILPLNEVYSYAGDGVDIFSVDLAELLKIVKYSEDPNELGYRKGNNKNSSLFNLPFPSFAYKTDEPHLSNCISNLKNNINGQKRYGLTIKRDGSSFSLFTIKNEYGEYENIICSRNFSKRIILKSENESDDPWVNIAFKSGLYYKALEYCKKYDVSLGFRGEIIGDKMNGSGNKRNPDKDSEQRLVLFGIDQYKNGGFRRVHYGEEHNLKKVGDEIGVEYTKVKEVIPETLDDLMSEIQKIIDEEKENGRLIEGVVVRTMDSNYVSVKYINPEYDSYK